MLAVAVVALPSGASALLGGSASSPAAAPHSPTFTTTLTMAHLALEWITITLGAMAFALAWNVRHRNDGAPHQSSHHILLSAGLIAASLCDFGHAVLSPQLLNLAAQPSGNPAALLWLASRLIAAVILLALALSPLRVWPPKAGYGALALALLLPLALTSIAWTGHRGGAWSGQALAATHHAWLVALYALAAVLLWQRRKDGSLWPWLAGAASVHALAQVLFSQASGPLDLSALLGHAYKALGGLMVYRALFVQEVAAPYHQLDTELQRHRALLDAAQRNQERLQVFANVFTHSREGIMVTDAQGNITEVNEAFTRITGYPRDEVLGRNPRLLSSGRQGHDYYHHMWSSLANQGYWSGEVWNRRKSGEVFAELQTISSVRDASGQIVQYVSLFSDISSFKEHERRLAHITHFDALTGLPNRTLLSDRLQQAIAQRRGLQLAVAFIDLDGFKEINDRHGHEAGDHYLQALAARLKHELREGDTLARLGGDEFVAVLIGLSDPTACVPLLSRLLHAAAEPLPVDDMLLAVSASIGVTFYPQPDDVDGEMLIRQADQAMYQAKLAGKNRFHIFDAVQDRSVRGQHESLEHIRAALAHDEFLLYYQPKVNMRTGEVMGAEALIRWQHPTRGLLAPGVFLPVLENHPLGIAVGEWVIDAALQQLAQWQAQGFETHVSVNVGALQLQQPHFVEHLKTLLDSHPQINPSQLELEVLETSALEDVDRVSHVIDACRHLGVSFALDDFGTGYSSLTYLKRLPVRKLKIDQSFVRDMLDDPDDLAILQGVIGLARAFKRDVIAEGVETVEHGRRLLELGCELAQGYGVARPMPADQFPSWAGEWKSELAWSRLTQDQAAKRYNEET